MQHWSNRILATYTPGARAALVAAGILWTGSSIPVFAEVGLIGNVVGVHPAVGPEYFETFLFSNYGGSQYGPRQCRIQFKRSGDTMINSIDRSCHLSDAQRAKLQLAARGDINRIFDRIEVARIQFEKQRLQGVAPRELVMDLQKLQTEIRVGPFVSQSLLRKSLASVLSPEQLDKYQTADREERISKRRSLISGLIVELETTYRTVPIEQQGAVHLVMVQAPQGNRAEPTRLEPKQRAQLIELLEKELPLSPASPYLALSVRYHCSRIAADKWKTVLNEKQWEAWSPRLRQFEGYKRTLDRIGMAEAEPENDLLPPVKPGRPAATVGGSS